MWSKYLSNNEWGDLRLSMSAPSGVKIRPMARKFTCVPLELTFGGPAGPADFRAIVISFEVSLTKKINLALK